MAKLKMVKITIAAMLSDSKLIIERLQRRGVVELVPVSDDNLAKLDTQSAVSTFERNLSNTKKALEIIKGYHQEKTSLISSLEGRKTMTTRDFAEKSDNISKTVDLVYSVIDTEKTVSQANDEIRKIKTNIEKTLPWKEYDLALSFSGTKKTGTILGTFPKHISAEEISDSVREISGKEIYSEVFFDLSGQTRAFIVCMKEETEEVLAALRTQGFLNARFTDAVTAAESVRNDEAKIVSLQEKIRNAEEKLRSFAKKKADIEFLADYLVLKIDKYKALFSVGLTEKTIIIKGYVPEKYSSALEKEFESKYTVFITFENPEEDEDTPVLLQNGKFSAPLEGITEMYALPNKKDIDPSAVMAFFYYLFFGMMLSDAGYGLLMLVGCSVILKKINLEEKMRKSMTLFRNCGVSTLFWGILFGSWFGDLPQIIGTNFFGTSDFSTALWFEPLDKPITLLLFSFGLGIVHLFLGLATHFYILWKDGKKMDAVCEVVPTYITILGVCPLGASILTSVPPVLCTVGLYMLLAGVVLVILTAGRTNKNFIMRIFGGLYGLYNIATGYLGDILSYSRLLALGLATGSIAGVINLIATMPDNKVLKAIMLVVVGTVGHIANMAVNLLGAYVHSDRLQFVELFSKFYEGGGRAFNPLKSNTKSFKFKKENIYDD